MSNLPVDDDGKIKKSRGRKKGSKNKTTTILKEAILLAAEAVGGRQGLVGYLKKQAKMNPVAFMNLLAKVLPHTVVGAVDHKHEHSHEHILAGSEEFRRRIALLGARAREGENLKIVDATPTGSTIVGVELLGKAKSEAA